jgi:uncharacterized protein YdhG (YjbR/CyaY superfamily)
MKSTRTTPRTIDEYLGRLTSDKRDALEKLRRAIKTAAPRAEECISYQIPAFRLDGKVLVWFHAATNHCSFFPGAAPIALYRHELEKYETRKGTVHFSPEKPLPATLVKKLVKARIAELSGTTKSKGK